MEHELGGRGGCPRGDRAVGCSSPTRSALRRLGGSLALPICASALPPKLAGVLSAGPLVLRWAPSGAQVSAGWGLGTLGVSGEQCGAPEAPLTPPRREVLNHGDDGGRRIDRLDPRLGSRHDFRD